MTSFKQLARQLGLGLGLFAAGIVSAANSPARLDPLVSGTAHQALYSIAFDANSGIAVGAAGAVLNSADGGRSWTVLKPAPTELSLLGADVSRSRQFAVGQMGLILVKEAAGAWQKMESGTSDRLFAVSANANGLVVTVGAFGIVLKSADGGNSWKSVAPDWATYAEPGVQPHLYDVEVNDAGLITLAGEFGLILRSADGGASWHALHRGDASIFALDLRADGAGYAVGQNGTVLRTADGGSSWVAVDAGTQAILLGVHSSADGQVIATGMRDMVVSTDGGQSWRHVSDGDVTTSWYEDVSVASAGGATYAVGNHGRIVRIGN